MSHILVYILCCDDDTERLKLQLFSLASVKVTYVSRDGNVPLPAKAIIVECVS